MSYTPTTWTTGDTITASAMNKIEQGVANAGSTLIVNQGGNGALDKTVQEIYEALSTGTPVYIRFVYGDIYNLSNFQAYLMFYEVKTVYRYGEEQYYVFAQPVNASTSAIKPYTNVYMASTIAGYPVLTYIDMVNSTAVTRYNA